MWIPFLTVLGTCGIISASSKFRCFYDSFYNFTEADLNSPEVLVNGSKRCLDLNRCTVVTAFGFNHSVNTGPAISTLIPTFIAQKKCNVMLVNWDKAASDLGLGAVLGYIVNALPNTKIVGIETGEGLEKLYSLGLNESIYLVGHSLGAHMLAYAAREAKKKMEIEKLTALDPALMGFSPPTLLKPVDPSCAKHVTGLHTDPNGYALNISVGHVDFWLNAGAFIDGPRLQPGCNQTSSEVDTATRGNRCNHDLSWKVFNVSLTQEHLFLASKASNYSEFQKQNGSSTDTNYIGPAEDTTKRGNYYLSTMAECPYGMGEEGLKP